MKTKSPKPPTFRKLMTQIRPLAEQLQTLNNQAGALGLFTEDRELLTCPRCGLEEDVSASGLLLTCRSASDGQDNGLRFRLVGEGRFRCPSCGQIVHAPLPERQPIGCPLTTRETKRMAARTATDGRRLQARPVHR